MVTTTRWERLKNRVRKAYKRVRTPTLVAIGVSLIIVSLYGFGLMQDPLKEGIKTGVPFIAVTWAVFQPWVAKRQADARRDHERHELRLAAASLAMMATDEIRRIADGYRRYADKVSVTVPQSFFQEAIESLNQFKADKVPDGAFLISLEKLRGLLRNAHQLVGRFATKRTIEEMSELPDHEFLLADLLTLQDGKSIADELDFLKERAEAHLRMLQP